MNFREERQKGLTLVELMVATTLSLVLLAGVLLVFSANKTTYQMQTGLGTLQENGRYAMNQITADLQMAGFAGCLSPKVPSPVRRTEVLAKNPPAYATGLSDGELFAGENDDDGTTRYPAGTGVNMVPGTDSIEIRGPLRSTLEFANGDVSTTGTVEIIGDDSGFAVNDILVLSDCEGADIFRATAVSISGGNTQLGHASAQNILGGNLSRPFTADSVVTRLGTHTYFIGDTTRLNTANQPILALYRFDGSSAVELVDGVEDLQVEYALDEDEDGKIEAYADSSGVTNWSQVMAVRVSLLLNSVNPASAVNARYTFGTVQIDPPASDLRLRQEFTALVAVRNSVI